MTEEAGRNRAGRLVGGRAGMHYTDRLGLLLISRWTKTALAEQIIAAHRGARDGPDGSAYLGRPERSPVARRP